MSFYFSGNTVDQNSVPVVGAKVYVYANGALANLIDADGDALANPLTTIADGFYEGRTNDRGAYKAEFFWGGKLRYVREFSQADEIEGFAATALAASGPNYASTAAGLAATTVGDTFAVDEGDTIAIYSHDAGSVATFLRRYPQNLAAPSGASLVGVPEGGSLGNKTGGWVTPEQFGAVGDGVANDTAALQDAADTGKAVILTAGRTYLFNADVTLSANFQYFGGTAVLKPSGNCGIVVSGAVGPRLELNFESAAHTGTALSIIGSDRVQVFRFNGVDVFNALYVEQSNVTTVDWLWSACRGSGITWFGNALKRSDILRVKFALMSVGSGAYGLDWDGNCHSLQSTYIGIVGGPLLSASNGRGVIIRNTSGGPAPAIGRFHDLQVDYAGTHGVEIQAGEDYDIALPYLQGCAGDGVRIGAAINDREVRIGGGKIKSNGGYGINNLGGVVLYSGNSDLTLNSSGAINGSVWTEAQRLALDATSYFVLESGSPTLSFDASDYIAYNRTANDLSFFIGGASKMIVANDRVELTAPPELPVTTVASLPVAAAGNAGREYYVSDANATTRLTTVAGGGSNFVKVFSNGTNWVIA